VHSRGLQTKIQSICNGKCDGNYNARSCDGEKKAAGAGTMANNGKNNGKNNAQGNGNRRKSERVLTHRLGISTPTKIIARRREAPGAYVQD
jgi:hypothetical protein